MQQEVKAVTTSARAGAQLVSTGMRPPLATSPTENAPVAPRGAGDAAGSKLTITVLGSGTSTGVPMIGCHCPVCTSADPRDRRSRSSLAVHYDEHHILIDCSPELRLQALAAKLDRVDAVVFTHAHADHIFGLDDLRRYNSILGGPLPIHASPETLTALRRFFPHAFAKPVEERLFRPELEPHPIDGPFDLLGTLWRPLELPHGRGAVLGFRIGAFAYCTDCSDVPETVLCQLQGLDVLILDALRPKPHPTHLCFSQALAIIERLKPRRAFFTHLSHDVFQAEAEAQLPPHVRLCYDGLTLTPDVRSAADQ